VIPRHHTGQVTADQIEWLDTTNHIDIYDRAEFVGPAVERGG